MFNKRRCWLETRGRWKVEKSKTSIYIYIYIWRGIWYLSHSVSLLSDISHQSLINSKVDVGMTIQSWENKNTKPQIFIATLYVTISPYNYTLFYFETSSNLMVVCYVFNWCNCMWQYQGCIKDRLKFWLVQGCLIRYQIKGYEWKHNTTLYLVLSL